jgi:hypothetical protein
LPVGSKYGEFLEHKPDVAVGADKLVELGRALPAVGTIVVEESDDADVALRVAGDEAIGRAENLLRVQGDRILLPYGLHIAQERIGRDGAGEPGTARRRAAEAGYAGGGPNTRTALRPPKAKEFDMA